MRINVTILLPVILGASVALTACSKKKENSDDPATTAGSVANTGGNPLPGSLVIRDVDSALVTGPTSGLRIASKLNLIGGAGGGASLALFDGTQGQFATDESRFYVDDRTFERLQSVSTILCFLDKTGYADEHVVNSGLYLAQVDMAACDDKGGGGGGGGGQGGQPQQKKVNLVNVTVDSTRDEGKALNARLWFDMKEDHGGGGGGSMIQRIGIRISVAQGPSTTNPLGIFRMTFVLSMGKDEASLQDGGHGQIQSHRDDTGNILLTFVEKNSFAEGAHSFSSDNGVSVAINVDPATGKIVGGKASITASEVETGKDARSENFAMAWNESGTDRLFQVLDTDAKNICRDQNDFNMSVWRYGVYDTSTGDRVKLKGGFPISYSNADGSRGHGWASYYGLWTEGSNLASGTEVTSDNFGEAAQTYHVVSGPGRLMKHVKTDVALDALDGIEIEMWSMEGSKRVAYNKAAGKFQVTGTRINGGSNGEEVVWTDVTPATDFTFAVYGNHSGWSQGLGGRVDFTVSNLGVATAAAIYADSDATASAGNISLYCLQGCLKSNLTTAMLVANAQNLVANAQNPWQPFDYAHAVSYTFDAAKYLMKDAGGAGVAMAAGETIPDGSWAGMQSLVDAATLAAMQASGAQPYEAGQQTVSYSWNIGDDNHPWNRYMALADAAGVPVAFDPPMLIAYTHTEANDLTGAAAAKTFGKTFHLQFDGSNLSIPGHPDSDSGFYVNDFTIRAGATSDDGKYAFKPLEGSKYMKAVDIGRCTAAGLDVTSAPALPGADAYDETKANRDAAPDASSLKIAIINGDYQG